MRFPVRKEILWVYLGLIVVFAVSYFIYPLVYKSPLLYRPLEVSTADPSAPSDIESYSPLSMYFYCGLLIVTSIMGTVFCWERFIPERNSFLLVLLLSLFTLAGVILLY